ncbi:MAG TPA: leucine--tRNA ligase [Cytophagales bacterium]|nr:leucine--tRNA ligase [Cytophagales bacterium]
MADYNHKDIERFWQNYWKENNTFKTTTDQSKPKYYVLDMFPYPSGAGLHVGHPLGYIASDIVSRFKRLKGFNVLHPMGFDSFGLPAEQYAVQTGQHPAITTEKNISRYKEQLDNIGFTFDWSREVRTSEPNYYKWTQWIFIQLFHSWYNKATDKAEPIQSLIEKFEKEGNSKVNAACDEETPVISVEDWKQMNEKEKLEFLLRYRLTYLADTMVNWCPALGTVLANEEVKDGFSERGGFPVVRKKMSQWSMRISAYAERLLQGLETIDWPEPMKDMQRNWIGKSMGAELLFKVEGKSTEIKVFTTRVDTTFGVTYLALAPEHELVSELTTPEYAEKVKEYIEIAGNRSERDRMSDVKTISGQFTGAYAINPFKDEKIPIWIADYVLAGYGTGAVMAVPSSDTRDYAFAKHFNLPIIQVQEGEGTDISQENFDPKKGTMINSDFLNGLPVKEAIQKAIAFVEEKGLGKGKINYRMRDAIFSRQRYWGEPIPVYYKDGIAYSLDEKELPLVLPEIDEYKPTETGEPPLGRAKNFKTKEGYPLELNTMPGWAGSSWYFLRYMDPKNEDRFVGKEKEKYWNQVDLYIGGAEHATGHLLYSRFWNKFLFDLGLVTSDEPFKKLINQGMIQGRSNFVYRINGTNKYVSYGLKGNYETTAFHVDVNIVQNDVLDLEAFKKWRPDLADAEFVLEDGKYNCGHEVEKMSKSKYNVVNPDDIVDQYGADTLRLYEMFLGPLEQFKPWNTQGIEGVYKFLRKLWRLFFDEKGGLKVTDQAPTPEEFKALHQTIKKVEEDINRYSFNTSVSTFMICVNTLSELKSNKKAILQDLLIVLSPYAPHISEELWKVLGNKESITYAQYPKWEEKYLIEDSFEYPISINGKLRTKMTFSLDTTPQEIEKSVLASEQVQKWLEGKTPKKIIVVPKKIVNLVI